MRHRLAVLACLAALTTAACGTPPHQIESLRFSDSAVPGAALSHTDLYDARFELGFATNIHAHLDVAYTPGWWTKTVTLTCTLTGPMSPLPRTIEQPVALPSVGTATTWVVMLSAPEPARWVAGDYRLRCETPGSSAQGNFRIVDPTPMLGKGSTKSLLDLLGSQNRGTPGPTGEAQQDTTAKTPSPPSDGFSMFNDAFNHEHGIPPKEAPSTTFAPRIYASDEKTGPFQTDQDSFDTEVTRFIAYDFSIPNTVSEYRYDGCAFERRVNGVVSGGNHWMALSAADEDWAFGGSSGTEDPGFWLPGEYRILCSSRGITLSPRTFSVYGRPSNTSVVLLAGSVPFAELKPKSLQLFESGAASRPQPVEYWSTIAGRPRFIGAETTVDVEPSPTPITFKYTCHFFQSTGRVIGRQDFDVVIPANESLWWMWVTWGNADGTFWTPGVYFVECDANGSMMASRYFTVE
jgi:hypothetical protein